MGRSHCHWFDSVSPALCLSQNRKGNSMTECTKRTREQIEEDVRQTNVEHQRLKSSIAVAQMIFAAHCAKRLGSDATPLDALALAEESIDCLKATYDERSKRIGEKLQALQDELEIDHQQCGCPLCQLGRQIGLT